MAGTAGPRRKVTVTGRMIMEFDYSEWRDLDEDRDTYAAGLFRKVKRFPFTCPENLKLVSIVHTGTTGSKEKK